MKKFHVGRSSTSSDFPISNAQLKPSRRLNSDQQRHVVVENNGAELYLSPDWGSGQQREGDFEDFTGVSCA